MVSNWNRNEPLWRRKELRFTAIDAGANVIEITGQPHVIAIKMRDPFSGFSCQLFDAGLRSGKAIGMFFQFSSPEVEQVTRRHKTD